MRTTSMMGSRRMSNPILIPGSSPKGEERDKLRYVPNYQIYTKRSLLMTSTKIRYWMIIRNQMKSFKINIM